MRRASVDVFLVLVLMIVTCLTISSALRVGSKLLQCPSHGLANGLVVPRARGRFVRYKCISGYRILGDKSATCLRGEWEYQDQKPVCVQSGCASLSAPVSGAKKAMPGFAGWVVGFTCDVGFALTGSPAAFCNGVRWNATAPTCAAVQSEVSPSCDFEREDLCGWRQDPNHVFDWTRQSGPTPSAGTGTGPSWDHTYGREAAGHYMYIESSSPRMENDTARLISPVFPAELSQDACFIFYYHMHGLYIGTLNVYVKPVGQLGRTRIFSATGQQGIKWIRAISRIDPLDESFQVVVEGVRGAGYGGDVAIDDVMLANDTDCDVTATTTDAATVDTVVPYANLLTPDSCRFRCFVTTPTSRYDADVGVGVGVEVEAPYCGCQESCRFHDKSCCDDFDWLCLARAEGPTSTLAPTAASHRTVASIPYAPPNATLPSPPMPSLPPRPSPSPVTLPPSSPLPSSPTSLSSTKSSPLSSPTSTTYKPSFTNASTPPIPTDKVTSSTNKSTLTSTAGSSDVLAKSSTSPTQSILIDVTLSKVATIAKTSTVILTASTASTVMSTKSSTLPTKAAVLSTKEASLSTKSTTLSTSLTSLLTKSTNLLTKSTTLPTKSTTIPSKSTSLPTKSPTLPTKRITLPTKSTTLSTKATSTPRWPKPTPQTTATLIPESSTSPAWQKTTSKLSSKTNDKQNSVEEKSQLDLETRYFENAPLLKEKPAKNKDSSWQMAQRSPPGLGVATLALYLALAAAGCVVLAVALATGVLLVRRRRGTRLRRELNDDSEVRFLTAEEILDFNIAQPKDDEF